MQQFNLTKTGNDLKGNRALYEALKSLPEGRWTVTISKAKKKRSLLENNFYWGYFVQYEIDCFYEFWGEKYDKEQVHNWNKVNFFCDIHYVEKTGEVVKLPGSTKDQSTVSFEEKLDDIRQWFWLNFEYKIPYPNEQGEMF